MKAIISAEELKTLIGKDNTVVLDARTGKEAHESYLKKHIKGARFIDLNTDLADIGEDAAFGGRHPLPTPDKFSETLFNLGISAKDNIVVYDTAKGANAAARAWWMLKAAGLHTSVLSGGLQMAEDAGIEMSSGEETFPKSHNIELKQWQLPVSTLENVEKGLAEHSATVIDVRDSYRYRGESEPLDLVAGHIPGAFNIPFSENLEDDGHFLSPEILKKKYSDFLQNKPDEVIIHCGSGVTACHTILAMAYAGLEIPKLYVGSWSEWSRSGKPISTEN